MKKVNKKTTMGDIAQILGISKNSVSLALNGKPGVSEELRNRVIDLAIKMEYGKYSTLANEKSKCLIIIVPHYIRNDTFFYSDVFWAIEEEAKAQDCITITSGLSLEDEEKLLLPSIPQEMNVLGFLLVGIVSDFYLEKLYEAKLPVVSVDISYNNISTNSISTANVTSGYMAAKHLIDRGHKKIGFAGPIFTAQSVYERWCGFQQALLHHDLPLLQNCNILGNKNQFELFDTVEVLEKYVQNIHDYPTAWFCAGDRIAVAMSSILSRRFRIPEDISIIGFDDLPISEMVVPRLTTIRVDRKLMGKLAVQRLIQLQEGLPHVLNISIPGKLIIRESVKDISKDSPD